MSEQAEAAAITTCPVCGSAVEPGDRFCETCGSALVPGTQPDLAQAGPMGTRGAAGAPATDATATAGANDGGPPGDSSPGAPRPGEATLTAPTGHSAPTAPAGPFGRSAPCVRCGAQPADIDADGYCTICGLLQPGPREHVELDLGWAAGVTDRGLHHPRNEDAFHLELAGPAAGHGVVAVVCDGVSSSVRAEDAAESAAAAAATVLSAVVGGAGSLADATVHAADAASRAVTALPWTATERLASPACTLVSAACRNGHIAVGWVGDSRAYWQSAASQEIRRLTIDDSWAETQVESGRMTEAEAEADPRSHAITRWIGADAPEVDARVITLEPTSPGRLLLCSDGLWNYAPTTRDMAGLLDRQPAGTTPIELARSLTDFARRSGGHDNITVVVIDLPARDAEEKGTP